jgi:hypothetical protein
MTSDLAWDIFERALMTFAQAFISVWVVSSWADLSDVNLAKQAVVAGVAAVLSLAKGMLASRVGVKGTAALLPD